MHIIKQKSLSTYQNESFNFVIEAKCSVSACNMDFTLNLFIKYAHRGKNNCKRNLHRIKI